MNNILLKSIAKNMVANGKGILAADESSKTIQKRFDKIGLKSDPDTNLAYRKMLFTTPSIENYISGIILFDETFRQSIDGVLIPEYLSKKGILPGIKVDKGTVDLSGSQGEKITEGLDGLKERLKEYGKLGAKFAKWRAVITIGENIPTDNCIDANSEVLAKYAALCQEQDIVPIVEPEVLMDGDNTLEICRDATSRTLHSLFAKLKDNNVILEGLILKTNMVISGKKCPVQANSKEIAKETVATFLKVVPREIVGIVFLSGGQTPDQATENLAEINRIPSSPWQLSYSYGRALQDEALTAWAGKNENVKVAQKVFLERVKKVSQARSQQPS
jgi:fructose-bisphosphate aldolase class I